jgi:hypothetical protein
MGRIISIISFFFSYAITAFATFDTTLQLTYQKTIPGNYSNFYTDNLGNVFLLANNNQIKKFDQNLDSVGVFNDVRRYGNIYSLDVSNPLKILVYYKDFTTILTLDRFLNIRNTIDLRNSNILQAKAVAQSYDNNYWVFDELDNAIKKIDDNGNVLLKSADFRVVFSEQYSPSVMIDQNNQLYLYDENKGWLVFDYYGTFKKRIEIPGHKDVQLTNNILMTHDSSYFYYYNLKSFIETKASSPQINLRTAIKVQQTLNKIFVLQKDGLSVYSLTNQQ